MTIEQRIATLHPQIHQVLMPADVIERIPALYAQDGMGMEATIHVKFFGSGRWTWYATEACAELYDGAELVEKALSDLRPEEPIDDVQFFGYILSGLGPDCDELGYWRLSDLTQIQFPPFGLPIERDEHFPPQTLSAALGKVAL